jgi:hypothetical protein
MSPLISSLFVFGRGAKWHFFDVLLYVGQLRNRNLSDHLELVRPFHTGQAPYLIKIRAKVSDVCDFAENDSDLKIMTAPPTRCVHFRKALNVSDVNNLFAPNPGLLRILKARRQGIVIGEEANATADVVCKVNDSVVRRVITACADSKLLVIHWI